jgi:hypothetical protein
MRRWFNGAAAWLRKRWLLLALVALVTVALIVAALMVLHLSEYPARRAASLRQSIEDASRSGLRINERLALEKDLLQYEMDNRVKIWTTIVQASGGAVLLVGLLFTWRNLRATQVKLDIDREGQLNNRFTQATTQLGAQLSDGRPNVEARLGGIYALSWIARDSPDNYWPVMEILTAYVRHNAAWPPSGKVTQAAVSRRWIHRIWTVPLAAAGAALLPSLPGGPDQSKPRTDIQAILTVLGRSKPPEAKSLRLDQKFDLRFTDLRGAEFWDAHLENTDFWGAHLEGANLWGTCLRNAKLVEAHLEGANLRGVILAGADLSYACLDGANLQNADLRFATGLSQVQVESALQRGRGALLPPHLNSPQHIQI